MGAVRILILIVAVVAAGGTAYLVSRLVVPAETPTPVIAAPEVDLQPVLVAARDIEIGERLGAGDFVWRDWPGNAVAPAYFTRARTPDAIINMTGSVARAPLVQGEPIVEAKLIRGDGGGFMATRLRPGMRALSISISAETGAGGFILPNDRVDVILTRRTDNDGGMIDEMFRSETILRDVRVLAIDQNYEQVEGKQVFVGKTATLELTPSKAETLALADLAGDIQLSLRSITTPDSAEPAEVDTRRSTGVTVVRYGVSNRVSVSSSRQ